MKIKMAIEKMKLLSITGSERELDRFVARNLLNSDIQIEDAKKVYSKAWKFQYYDYDYTVKDNLKKCQTLIEKLRIPYREEYSNLYVENTVLQIEEKIKAIEETYDKLTNQITNLQEEKENDLKKIASVEKLNDLDIDISRLYHLKYIKFRYGNIANEDLEQIRGQLEDMNVILFEIEKQEDVTWLVYLTPKEFEQSVDVFFNMQNFERVWLDNDLSGKPKEYIDKIYREISQKSQKIQECEKELKAMAENCRHILLSSYRQLQTYQKINKIKKYIMHDSKQTFYIVAWVPETEMKNMIDKLDSCQNIDYKIEEKKETQSPTKLRNNKLFKPFELLVKMYGVPNNNEIDPTSFVAITAFIMFGFMFGDVGHGLVFLIVGLLYRKSHKEAGDILMAGGIASTIFGFLYGSVFGKEELIPAKLIRPMENINTMLVYGIIVGCIFILMAMLFNIINGIKTRDWKRVFLDRKWSRRTCFIWICLVFDSVLFPNRKDVYLYQFDCNNCMYFIITNPI